MYNFAGIYRPVTFKTYTLFLLLLHDTAGPDKTIKILHRFINILLKF